MAKMSAPEVERHLVSLIKRVNENRIPVYITSQHGNAVLISEADYEAWQETKELLRSPGNVNHLMESITEAKVCLRERHKLV